MDFRREKDIFNYHGKSKIPMETFHEMYFDGDVDFKGDALEALEYRHDWASFRFTLGLCRFFLTVMLPEVIMHTRSQGKLVWYRSLVVVLTRTDEEQVRDHYDRGDDFYGWFLGPRMIYTSGIISDINKEETLEQLQDNKVAVVCEKIGLRPGEKMLDIGCGWGTLARFASAQYGAHVTGITLGRNQTAWGNNGLKKAGIDESQSKILCMDYRDIPVPAGGYKKITCLEMAEHVGVRHLSAFFSQVHDMLDDDGVFFLQIAGLRKCWQYEDLIWGLFMNKYIFPGADASTPLGFVVDRLERAGFEVKNIDTVGVHYSATLWRWYRNWIANKEKVVAKYGDRWYRVCPVGEILISVSLVFTDSITYINRFGNTFSRTRRSSHAKVPPHASILLWSKTSTPLIASKAFRPNSAFMVRWLPQRYHHLLLTMLIWLG